MAYQPFQTIGFPLPPRIGGRGFLFVATAITAVIFSSIAATAAEKPIEVYNLTQGKPVLIAAKKTKFPLIVYGEEKGSIGTFVPSGFMGDADSMKIKSSDFSAPLTSSKTGTGALKVEILPQGAQGWVGVYWQTPANNWGKIKGAGYDLSRATKLSFWARGEKGGEIIAEFKMGGLIGPYPDTDSASMGPVKLSKEWTHYAIDLTGKDLRHILGGFSFSVRRAQNPRGLTFYLDEIMYEGSNLPEDAPPSVVQVHSDVEGASPTSAVLKKTVRITIPYPDTKTAFSADGLEPLDEFAGVAAKYPESLILVQGHTDNLGPKEANKKLSLDRAKAVADYLAGKNISRDRMTVEGYGGERLLHEGPGVTKQQRYDNQRVELTLQPKQ